MYVAFVVLDYMEEIFQTFIKASKEEIIDAAAKLREKTPAAMNTMLEKQSREEAIKRKEERSQMVVKDVSPTTPGTSSQYYTGGLSCSFYQNDVILLFTDIHYKIIIILIIIIIIIISLVSQVTQGNTQQNNEKRTRTCKKCKNPSKGYKNVLDCPRNKK